MQVWLRQATKVTGPGWVLSRACGLAGVLLLLAALAGAQQAAGPDAAKPKDHAASAGDKPASEKSSPGRSTADEHPFPEDTSRKAATQDKSVPPSTSVPPSGTQPADAQQTAKPDAATDNPFPEDVSRRAAEKAAAGDSPSGAADAGSSSSNSDSSSSSSSSSAGNAAAGNDPDAAPDVPASSGRRRLKKPSGKDIQSGSLAGEGRAEEDVRVGRYYLSQHNYQGAYARFQEATRLDPVNVEAIYGTAASAEGLHKMDEALQNYKLYLQIAPDGEHAKAVERSLRTLSH